MEETARASVQLLCTRIIEQAVDDYRELKKKKLSSRETKDKGEYSITEIEEFFHSAWCNEIILKRGLESRVDGVTILRHLKSETA